MRPCGPLVPLLADGSAEAGVGTVVQRFGFQYHLPLIQNGLDLGLPLQKQVTAELVHVAHAGTVVKMAELDTTEPAGTISRCAKIILGYHLEVSTAEKVDINFGFLVLDVVGQIFGILPEGLRLHNADFRDADSDIISKFYQPVQTIPAVLKVEDIDLLITGQQPAHPLPEVPGILYTQNLLTVDLDTGGLDAVLLYELHQTVLPHGKALPGLIHALTGTEHKSEKSAVLYDMAVRSVLFFDNMAVGEPEVRVGLLSVYVLVAGIQPVIGLCG